MDGQTTDHGYTISFPYGPFCSGELRRIVLLNSSIVPDFLNLRAKTVEYKTAAIIFAHLKLACNKVLLRFT